MTTSDASVWNPTPAHRRAWTVAGSLLIGYAAVEVAVQPLTQPLPKAIVSGVLFGAALLIFAVGTGSAVAHRPLGTVALVVAAVFPLLTIASAPLIAASPDGNLGLAFGYLDLGIRFVAALLAAVAIGRNGAVPRPWAWAPLWALVGITAAWLLGTLSFGTATAVVGQDAGFVLAGLQGTADVVASIFLGVLALVLPRTLNAGPGATERSKEQPVGVGSQPW